MIRLKNWFRRITNFSQPLLVGVCAFIFATSVFANPVLDNVAAGQVTIQQDTHSTIVNQTSQQAIVNWQSFNIGAQESTHFQQPAGGVALNRINPSQGVSEIYGRLTATGQIILVNPAGIFFGPGSYVNVGGLIASTANISNEDFLNNYYHFANVPGYNGAIVNQGQIIAAEHGLVALVGGAVSNEGLIQANIGHAVLASGNSFTMSFAGNDLIGFSVDSAATQRAIDKNGRELSVGANNSGTISANGGRILISAKAAAGILDNIINMQGIAQAQSFYESKGTIIMSGDTESGIVNIGGVVDVSGVLGGNIDITGYNILLGDNTLINANGNFGGGNINIGGNYLGQGPLPTANAVVLADGATITANAINAGNGGRVIVWSDYFTNANGSISATGGGESGNGGFIETSSKNILNVGDILVNTSAANGATGTWLLDPYDITISSSASSNGAFNGSNPNLFTPTGDANVLDSTINTNLGSANVTITTGNSGSPGSSNGNITVDATAAINWSSANTLTLTAYRNITIDNGATITATGGGILNLIANNSGFFPLNSDGTVTNNGAGNINVNGGLNVYYNPANYSSPLTYVNGTGSSTAYMYVNSAADLQNMSTNLAGFYALSTNISAGSFTPIGTLATPFTGGFDGLNHVITGLTISGATNNAGLFGVISSNNIFKNLHLANVNINHTTFATATGAFAGSADGNITITDISSTGSISGYYTGGIIGALNRISGSGTLSHAWSTATISGGGDTGGIVGAAALSTISNSYFGGTINNGGTFSTTGGILGFAAFASSVVDSYNTGTVNGGNFSSTGGIVGFATSGGTIDRSYNSGSVSGSGFVGSIVGQLNNGKTMTNSFWDTDTSGQSASYGTISGGASESNNFGGCFTGTCTNGGTVNLSDMGTYATWSISNTPSPNSVAPTQTWFIFQGATRPMLTMEQQENISNAHQLQMMGSTLGGIYTLENNIDFNSITRTADVWNMNFSTPTGAGGFVPIALGTNFSGSFDGQNNTITDLYINRAANNIGLFSTISSTATVSNLGLLSGSVTGSNNVGSVAGTNNGTITNSYNTGAFTATQYSGGIVGRNYGTVSDSYNTGNGTDSTGCVNCGYDVGGIAGRNETTGVISNSYNTGNITGVYGYNNKAGIAATNAGLITNSYNLGTITADYFHLGGIGGITTNNSGTISNSYNAGTVRSTSFANYGANGGIAAYNSGIITNTYNSGIVVFSGSLIGTIGGLVGENSGQITSSYNIGSVTAYDQAGGIVGNNVAAGVINNVYNMGSIVSTNNVNSGGIAGLNSGTISNTYSAGYVTPNSTSGGIIGANSVNTVTNSFWDSVTTGQASAVNSGTTTATMVAGSFDGTSGVNMKLANTFTSAPYNWDFATVWNIVSGQSYPYLRAFYSTTPRIISGTTGANANTSVNIIVNGAVVDSTITTALNTTSRYYLLQGLNNISGIDNSIADNTPILLYLNNGAQRANTVTITPNATGSLSNSTDVGLVNSTLTIGSAGVPPVTFSNSQLATLLGGLNNTDADFLYTYSGNNITLNSSNHFSAISNSSFTLDGNLATTAGNMTFSGPLAISGSRSLTSTTSGDITISSALNSPTAGLTINSAGTASLSTITSLTDLTVTAASGITVNGDITTSGNQTYSGVMTLLPASTTTFTTTGAGDITFNNHLISNNGINFAGSGVHTNAAGQVIFNGNIGNNAVQIDSVNLTAAGGIYFNGSSISTNQSQTYNSPIHLTGTVNFTNYLLAPIQFLSTIDGPGSFTSNFYSGSFAGTNPQVVTFGGAIGAATPLNNFTLSINQSAGVTFNNTLDASGAINITAAGGFFNATSTPPNVVFNAPVGSLTIPTSLSVTSAVAFVSYTPSIQFNNSVNTSGALTLSSRCDGPICTLNGPVTLNGTVGTLANPLGSLSALGSQINLNMDYIYSNGAQTYTGPVLLNSAGTASLISNNSNITMSSTVTGNGSNTLAITNASSSSISGVISNLALTKNGAGTLILVNNNTYTGGTTINAGTLQVGNGGATGAITGNIANSTSLVVNTANSFTLSGIISGNGSLTKSGSGTLTLSGTNTYGGNTTLNAGTIVIDANSIGSPVITSGPVGTGQLLLNGGTLASAGSYNILNPYTVAGSVALDGGTSLTLSGAGTLSSGSLNVLGSTVILSGDLTGSAPINALNTGNTFLTLSRVGGNNNGYSGTISFIGYLTAGAATNSFGTGSLIFATAGAESNLSSSVGAVINNNWTVNNGGSSASLSGSLTMGPTGTGTISNGSTLYLSNSPGDTLTLSGNLSGSGTIINNNGFSPIISGNNTNFTGTFNLDTATTTIISSTTNALGTGALIINNGAITTTTNTTLGNSSVTVTGNAQLTGANNISIAAPISLSSGTLFVTNTAGTVTLSGNISGSAPISKSGGGTLTISGGNNSGFLGSTTLSAGQLTITSPTNALGSGVGAILNLNGGNLQSSVTTTLTNPFTLSASSTINGSNNLTLSGAGALNTGTLTITNSAITSLSGVLSSAGGITLNSSSGTLNLTNSNTYTGATTISSGTLNVTAFANNGSASSIGAGTVLNIGASGVLQYTGGSAASTNRMIGLTGSGATIDASGGLLTLSGSVTGTNTNLNLIGSGSGALTNSIGTGNGTLTKDGSGTWTLGNANTYTGATFINGGTLSVGTLANYGSNSSLGAAASPTAITLSGGGILSYTGAPVTMNRNISTSTGGGTFLTTNTSISTPFVLSGNIDNANGLTLSSRYLQATGVISGAGNLTLTSSQTNARIDLTNALNSYTGQTIATHASSNGLAVYASSIADGGVNSALGATVASTPISLNNAGLIYTGGAASSDRQIIMSGTSPYVMNLGSGKLTLNGNIATNATYATFDAGANQLDLNGVISGNSSYIYFLAPANSTIRINNTANTFTGTARLTSYLYSGNVVITSLADAGVPSSLGAGTGNLFYVAGQDGPSTLVYTGGTTSTNRGIAMEYFYGAEPIFTNASAGTTVTFTGGIDLGYMNFNFANMVGDVVLSGQIIGSEYARILTSGTGAGSLTINNNTNTFGGGVFLTGGILNYTSVSAINGGASALGSSDGTYGLWIGGTGILRYIGSSPATTNRSITLTSSGGTLENASSSALTFSGNVTGNTFGLNLSGTGNSTLSGIIGTTTGGLTKSGSGTWTLGNANTYTGATSITGGTLSVGTLANSGSNSSLGAGATAISLSGGGILSYTGATTSTNRQFATSGTGGTIQNTTANTLTLSGAIDNSGSDLTLNTTNSSGNITASNSSNSISGAGSLTKSGTGTLTLSGLNSYTGATFINAGTLVASNASSLGSGATQSSSTTIASGATLSLQTSLSNTNQITLSGSGNGSLSALVNTTFTQRTLSNPLVLAGNTTIGGSFGELILTGNVTESSVGSILTKTGNSTIYLRGDNSFTGATNVSQGMLAITSANGLGSGLTQSNGINVTSGASLYFDAAITLNNTSTITLAGTGVAPSFGALTYASGSGGNVILNNPITLASNINIGAANGGGSDHLVLNGNITGAFSITKEGLIALDLNGNNSYSGGTTINGSSFGRIEVGHASALGTGPININSGGLLEINLNNTALANNNTITMGSGGGYLLHNGTGTVTVNNPITLNSGSSISINALPVSSNFVISNSITTNNAPININNYTSLGTVNGNVTLSGVIGGNGSLTKAGAGTSLILSNNNLYTGTTTINAGTLQVGNGGTTGSLGSGAVTNNGALTFNRNNAFTVSNAISGSGALTQMGTGSTLTLSGNNSYTGATNIDNGILQVTNLNALGCNNINGCGYNLASSAINIATGSQLLITPNLVTDTTLSNTSALITLNGSGVSGTGALRLAPINSTLSLNNNMQIASDSTISAFRVTLNGNITNSAVNTPSTLSLLLDLNGYTQLNGIISDGAGLSSLALSVTGVGGDITGYAILNGNNTFTGATTITNGTLSARNANALGSGATQSASIMVNTGGRLELDNFSGVFGNNRDITLNGYGPSGDSADDYALIIDNGIMGSITLNNNINIGSDTSIYAAPIINMTGASTGIINSAINTPATLMITTSFNTITIDHLIQDGAGSSVLNVVKRSLGSMILTADNNYTGTTSILNNGGTLQIGNGGATGTLGSGAVTNNSTLSFNRNNAATVTNTISGTGSLVQAGSGTTILTANNNYSGVTTINAGALQIGDTTTTGTLGTGTVTNNGALIVNRSNDITIANLINGSGTLTKNGTGILSITNANGYTGLTTVNAGTLSVGNNTSLGTNMLTLNAGTILQTEVTGVTLANDIILGGSSSISNNGLNFILSGDIDGANILTLNGSGTTTIDGAIGGTTKLTGVTANSDLIINGGGVTTTGDQLYANDVTLGNTTTFANDGVGSQNITFNGALNTGTSDVTLSGTNSGSYQFTINDINSASSTITVNASLASTNNSLLLNTGGTQNFVLTSNNTGTIAGITNVTGFNFTNIHNLNGGSGGLNSITAANTPNTWNISANDGGSVTNLTSFSNMQDLIGGTNSDIFNFVDGVTISGTVDGGDANDDSNHFDFGTIQDSLMLTLNMPILNVFDAGEVRSSSSALIATFSQIQRAIGYGNGYIMLPNAPNVKIFADTNPLYANNPKYGAIGDPFYFSNWTIGNPPPPVPSPTPTPAPGNTFNTPIANIVNQPVFNAVGNNNYSPPNMYGYLYDPSVVNKTYIDPILNTTILKAGSACYTTSR